MLAAMSIVEKTRKVACAGVISTLFVASYPVASAQDFSEWNQTTGMKSVEYRWKPNDAKGCDLEYRNLDDHDHKRYKSRIVFQLDGDEHVHTNSIVSFADSKSPADTVSNCTMITDISLTRF